MTLPFDAMHDEMRGAPAAASHGHHDAHAQPAATVPMDGAGMEIMRIRVRDRVRDERAVPATLSKIERPAESPFSPRLIVLDQAQGRWRINGRTYRIDETPLRVQRNTVEAWDIRNIPPDPFTNSADTWQQIQSDSDPANPAAEPGISDVKSGSEQTGMDGKPHSEW